MSAVIYARISADKTGEQAGVERQQDECRELAQARDLDVVDVLVDNDLSATSGKRRPGFERLVNMIETGAATQIIVWHPDRLYRMSRDLERIIDLVEGRSIHVLSVNAGTFDLNTPAGRAVARTIVSWSTYEVEQKNERQRAAARQRARAGKWWFSHRPFGYQRVDGAVVQVPSEARIVADLFDRFYVRGESRHSLVRDLNERGIRMPNGSEWGVIQLRDLLANGRYAGITYYRGEELGVDPQWEPIVDQAAFRVWQSQRAAAPRTSTFAPAKSLLTGIVRCGVCGAPCFTKARRSEPASSYTCSVGSCVSRSMRRVEELVETVLLRRLSDAEARELLINRSAPDLDQLLAERASTAASLDDLLQLIGRGTKRLATVLPIVDQLEAKIADLDDRIDRARAAAEIPDLLLAEDVETLWRERLTLPEKRAAVRAFLRIRLLPQGTRKFDPRAVEIRWASDDAQGEPLEPDS